MLSRKGGFYYGNKQNRFWSVLACAFNCEKPVTNEEKRDLVLRHGIALWDIVTECEIKGSMDADIKNHVVADLYTVLSQTKIRKILLNGSKAYEIFCANYPRLMGMAKKMPSTSSANVRFDMNEWIKELK